MAPPRKYTPPPEAQFFRSLMNEAGFTQEEASFALGVDASTIRRYLNGRLIVPEPILRLMMVFAWSNIDHEDLLGLFTPGARTVRFKKDSR